MFLWGAGFTDLWCGKVKNGWLLAGTLIGVWMRGTGFLADAAVVLVLTYWLFRLRMMGAGDGKLMALIAGYLGLESGMQAICTGMALGAIWSLCRLWHDKSLLTRFTYLNAYIRRTILTKEIIPYESLSAPENRAIQGAMLPQEDGAVQAAAPETAGGHRIPLAACLAAGVYLYLLISGAAAAGKEIL